MGAERRRKPCKRSSGSVSGLTVAFLMEMANGTVYADFALKIKKEISRVNETVSRRGK